MNYTLEKYTHDRKIARFTFKKYIGKHYQKEELIHVAILKLWTVRLEHGIVRNPVNVAKNAMLNFLREENSHCHYDSLYSDTKDDLPLIEVIPFEQPTAHDYCEYHELVKTLVPLPLIMSGRDRRIIALHLKHYTQREIAQRMELSQPYVNEIIQSFRRAARQVLDE